MRHLGVDMASQLAMQQGGKDHGRLLYSTGSLPGASLLEDNVTQRFPAHTGQSSGHVLQAHLLIHTLA